MSEIRIDLSGSDAESLKQLSSGDTLSLESVSGTVKSNDGKTLVASVDEMTCCEDETCDSESSDAEGEDMGDGGMTEDKGMNGMKGGHTPIAVIAIKAK